MEKILTVSIAAYNVSLYLRNALDSCVIPEIMDELEVLIVNDGSTDETSEIAKEYQEKYPDTFRLIDKENGGYGSTVNCTMAEATGKYFKLLDGDDWFDSDGLRKLIISLRDCEADLVLSRRTEVDPDGRKKTSENLWQKKYGSLYDRRTVPLDRLEPFVYGIWVATYRTEILKSHPFKLPEKQLYTDRIFVCFPIPWIKTISFQNYEVYCYRLGHEGQSVSAENRIRHSKETIDGFEYILNYYKGLTAVPLINKEFLNARIAIDYNNVIKTILMLPPSIKCQKEIKHLDEEIRNISEELYVCCGRNNKMLRRFRKYTYGLYWIRKLKKVKNWY